MKVRAIVLHVRNFGEAHRMVELLTAELGRVVAVARHARSSRKRFSGALDLFATIEAELVATSDLFRLERASLLDLRLGLRAELSCFARACKCCEAVHKLVAEHQASPHAYAALASALDRLEAGDAARAVAFYPELFTACGIMPEPGVGLCESCFERCARLPREVRATLAGEVCTREDTAALVERCALAFVEAQTQRGLKTRSIGA